MTVEQSVAGYSLQELLELRSRTDRIIPTSWVFISIASWAIWGLYVYYVVSNLMQAFTFTVQDFQDTTRGLPYPAPMRILEFAGLASSIVSSYVVYSLIDRRNKHIFRQEAILRRAVERATSGSAKEDLTAQLARDSIQRGLHRFAQEEKERSAYLWALLTIIPFLGWLFLAYVMAFLDADVTRHEWQERHAIEDLETLARPSTGQPLPQYSTPYYRPPSNTPVILTIALLFLGLLGTCVLILASEIGFAALTFYLVTGFLANFWLYSACRDGNLHFREHDIIEANLARGLQITLGGAGATS